MKSKSQFFLLPLAFCLLLLAPGCASTFNEGDTALLAQDLQDLAEAGTIYALAENPKLRADIVRVRDEIAARSAQLEGGPITFDELLARLNTLPVKELKSSEAVLAIAATRITLRRAGRNVELGNLPNLKPVADGLVLGMTAGLNTVPAI